MRIQLIGGLMIIIGIILIVGFAVFVPHALVVGSSTALLLFLLGGLFASGRWPPRR